MECAGYDLQLVMITLMDVVRSNVCQRRTGRVDGSRVVGRYARMSQSVLYKKKQKKTLTEVYLLTCMTSAGISGVSICCC